MWKFSCAVCVLALLFAANPSWAAFEKTETAELVRKELSEFVTKKCETLSDMTDAHKVEFVDSVMAYLDGHTHKFTDKEAEQFLGWFRVNCALGSVVFQWEKKVSMGQLCELQEKSINRFVRYLETDEETLKTIQEQIDELCEYAAKVFSEVFRENTGGSFLLPKELSAIVLGYLREEFGIEATKLSEALCVWCKQYVRQKAIDRPCCVALLPTADVIEDSMGEAKEIIAGEIKDLSANIDAEDVRDRMWSHLGFFAWQTQFAKYGEEKAAKNARNMIGCVFVSSVLIPIADRIEGNFPYGPQKEKPDKEKDEKESDQNKNPEK